MAKIDNLDVAEHMAFEEDGRRAQEIEYDARYRALQITYFEDCINIHAEYVRQNSEHYTGHNPHFRRTLHDCVLCDAHTHDRDNVCEKCRQARARNAETLLKKLLDPEPRPKRAYMVGYLRYRPSKAERKNEQMGRTGSHDLPRLIWALAGRFPGIGHRHDALQLGVLLGGGHDRLVYLHPQMAEKIEALVLAIRTELVNAYQDGLQNGSSIVAKLATGDLVISDFNAIKRLDNDQERNGKSPDAVS